jgi:hypothetical protein
MPTTDERLTTLETTSTQLQAELLLKAKLGEVKTVVQAAETRLDVNDTEHISFRDRLGRLERYFTALRSSIQGLNEDGIAVSNNYAATTAPGATDDGTKGYSIGSNWVNTATDTAYICVDSITNAAVWKQLTP